jgi:bacterioferritin
LERSRKGWTQINQREEVVKGNEKILKMMNARLADELGAINQYMVHSEMCADWGYDKLHEEVEKRAIDEMKHAESLIARILFLEGSPTVSKLSPIKIGADIETQLKNDLASEVAAVKDYNADMALAVEVGDNGTRELLEGILKDEETHTDWLEAQLEQIAQMGIQNYLAEQVGEE